MRLFLTCVLLLTVQLTSAQTSKSAEDCLQIENDLMRLMCYDALFMQSAGAEVTVGPSQVAPIAETALPQPSIEISPEATSVVADTGSIDAVTGDDGSAEESIMPTQRLVDNFGAEDLATPSNKEELSKIESVIESMSENNRNIRTFVLANGQVWQESESSRLRIKIGMPIYIEKGAFSAHFLGKESSNRRIRVNRVK